MREPVPFRPQAAAAAAEAACADKTLECASWAAGGECDRNPNAGSSDSDESSALLGHSLRSRDALGGFGAAVGSRPRRALLGLPPAVREL